jgi:hypothetical protein
VTSEPNRQQKIQRAEGVTPSERYLKRLCENSFLTLWSYPGIYRDQKAKSTGEGKEICDLLVVFGNDVIIFSDKHCKFANTDNLELDWRRWFKRAVADSAKQAWGAERWIRTNPARIFLDKACTQKFPFTLPDAGKARFHLVIVAHDLSRRCHEVFGGSGTLMIQSHLIGIAAHSVPFAVGDLDPEKSLVHVLDDVSLEIVLGTLDTISDFTAYLQKKESLLRSKTMIFAAGEEELLAIYLGKLNEKGEHDFVFPKGSENVNGIGLAEGHWEKFQSSPDRRAQFEANKISHVWDKLIERFSYYALRAEQYHSDPGSLGSTEIILRFMGREPRTRRRMLSKALMEMLEKTPAHARMTRIVLPSNPGDPHFVFLLFPMLEKHSYEDNRVVRRSFLEACCQVAKLKFPDAEDVVGIATESGFSNTDRSEDAVYFDARQWTRDLEDDARRLQRELGIFMELRESRFVEREYPTAVQEMEVPDNPRNKLCPCGSNKKYKRCHGK